MAQVKEEDYPAEAGAIGILIPIQRAVPVEEREEAGAVEETDRLDLPAIRIGLTEFRKGGDDLWIIIA